MKYFTLFIVKIFFVLLYVGNLNAQDVVGVVDSAGVLFIVNEYTSTGPSTFTVPKGVSNVDVLVVAGGGAGGGKFANQRGAGGGGAGGFIEQRFTVTPESTIDVTVGEGGEALTGPLDFTGKLTAGGLDRENDSIQLMGKNSTFGTTLTAFGGGYGGGGSDNNTYQPAQGGSGGGGACCGGGTNNIGGPWVDNNGVATTSTATTGDQGSFGGDGTDASANQDREGGGGGGATSAGGDATFNASGDGGTGKLSYILNERLAGGGGGGGHNSIGDGEDGGGDGASNNAGGDGDSNTGGGGGASGQGQPGNGGSGIVVVRYKLSDVTGELDLPAGNVNLPNGLAINGKIKVNGNATLPTSAAVTVAPGKGLEISGNLTLQDDAEIVLEADATNGNYGMLKFDGTVNLGTNASVTQQQNLAGGWHMVSAPMTATNAGFFGGIGSDAANGNSNTQNFFSWDGENFVNVPNNAATISPGTGYYGYVGQYGFQNAAGVYDFEGTPNTTATFALVNESANNNVTVDQGSNDGWNMLGNPFTCALDFGSLTLANVENTFYSFDPVSNDFVATSPAGLGDGLIAPLQAFWVRANGNGTPSIDDPTIAGNGIVSSSPDFFRTGNTFDRVVLRSAEVANPNFKDHTVIALIENTTDGFDNGWDARKMMPSENTPGIYTIGNGEGLANNAIDYGPNRSDKKSIDLAFRASKQGANYSIRFDEDFMVNEYTIYLEDKLLGQFHDLKSGDYVFANDTNNRERFVVHFRSGALSSDLEFANAANIRAWVYEGTAYIHPNVDLGRSDIRMMDMSGRTVFTTTEELRKDERREVGLPQLRAGVYLLQVGNEGVVKVVVQ